MHKKTQFPPDPVIEAYKEGVDRTLLRENLKLTPGERLRKHAAMVEFVVRNRGIARGRGRPPEDLDARATPEGQGAPGGDGEER